MARVAGTAGHSTPARTCKRVHTRGPMKRALALAASRGADGMSFDLAKIQDGSLKLSETINQVVLDSYCNPVIL